MPDLRFIKRQIKDFISVYDVYSKYVGGSRNTFNRYKCPFNNEEKRNNFGIKDNMWHCFSCGCGGDQISLVQKLFDLSAPDAMLKIATDFNLVTETNEEARKKIFIEEQRRKRQREKDQAYERLITETQSKVYGDLIKKEKQLEKIIRDNAPNCDNMVYYGLSSFCENSMRAIKELYYVRMMIDIIGEVANSKFEDELIFPAFTKQERHERMIRTINRIIKGELKI